MRQTFSRYEILEKLGQGGMATVYKAYDGRLDRNVAIKVIAGEAQDSQNFIKRFQQEARALANLSHPNIVQVLDFGEQEGVPFLVMDYLSGGTLKERLGKVYGWQEAAALLAPVARALAYAHDHKIVHRDVKPSNILFNSADEPVLTDFGIAKVLEQEKTTDLTGTGIIGTPQYMSPEQGMGKGVDERTDIYSLGVVLYELLTGKKPFSETTPVGILLQQTRQPLISPRKHNRNIPGWVEQIVFGALAPKPEDRFPTMQIFANALESMAKGEKVLLPKELLKRSRPLQKHIFWYWIASILVLIVILFALGIYWNNGRHAPITTPTVLALMVETTTPVPTRTMTLATSTQTLRPPTNTLPAPSETPTLVPTQKIRTILRDNLDSLQIMDQAEHLLGNIQFCAFSPDGKNAVISSEGKSGEVWDLPAKKVLRNLTGSDGLPLSIQRASFSPDGNLIAGLVDFGDVWVWKLGDGTLLQSITGKSQNLAFSPDSQKLAISYYEELYAKVWEISSGTQTGQYLQRSKIEHIAFSPDGLQLWVNTSLSLNIWRVLDGTQINQLTDLEIANGSFTVISPSSDLFYTNGRLWRVSDFSLASTLSTKQDPYPCAVFSPDEKLLVACNGSKFLIWDTGNGTLLRTVETGLQADMIGIAFTSNGENLLLSTSDGSIQTWGIQ